MEVAQANDFSATFTRQAFTTNVKFLLTPLRCGRVEDETKMRQCTFGELCSAATVSRPATCALLARISPQSKSLCGGDAYCIKERARAARKWRKATVLKYASPSHLWRRLGFEGKAKYDLRRRREKLRCGTSRLVGRPDAAYGNQVDGRQVPNGICDW